MRDGELMIDEPAAEQSADQITEPRPHDSASVLTTECGAEYSEDGDVVDWLCGKPYGHAEAEHAAGWVTDGEMTATYHTWKDGD